MKLVRYARMRVDIAGLKVLQRMFGFHPWHASSPVSARPYRRRIASWVNALQPAIVVEVGCGLGAILSEIRAKHRIGYDIDPKVVRAARLLRSRAISFRVGGFGQIRESGVDVLIAVNWIHDFSPEQLQAWLTPLISRTRFLILDTIAEDTPGYNHYHDFAFLDDLVSKRREHSLGEPNRRFILYEVLPSIGAAPVQKKGARH